MRHRNPPSPTRFDFNRRKLALDPQVRAYQRRLTGGASGTSAAGLTEEQRAFVESEILKDRASEFRPDAYLRAMRETRPVLAYPDMTDIPDDLRLMLTLPEMLRFWAGWQGEVGERGPCPRYGWSKAAMTLMAMTGQSSYLDDACATLAESPRLRELFADIDETARQDVEPSPERSVQEDWLAMPKYPTIARLLPRLARSARQNALAANVALVRSLRALYPQVGKRLLIDGTAVPAWAVQRGNGDDTARDEYLRRRTPEAHFRYIGYTKDGKYVAPTAKRPDGARAGHARFFRGYWLVCILDQATGLPLVWTLISARHDEASAIVSLLSLLHKLWPDIDAECIAGDSAWDEDEWCRLCEVEYGIHPIFRLHDARTTPITDGIKEGASIVIIHADGRLVCAAHGKPLPYETASVANRDQLRPGQPAREGDFRVRALCTHNRPTKPPCGKPGLPMRRDWSKLTYYPHHPYGHAKRYAYREAMLARLSQVESFFHHLKGGLKLANAGAARTRLIDKDTVDALISLACLSTTALAVADQRMHGQLVTGAGQQPGARAA